MNLRVHVFIRGDVIGVGFRAWIYRQAVKLGVTGWVRNFSDNTVEALFEGPKEKVDEMVLLCKQGPDVAWVEKVEIQEEEYKSEFDSFQIRI